MQFVLQRLSVQKGEGEPRWRAVAFYSTIKQLSAGVAHSAAYLSVNERERAAEVYGDLQRFIDKAELSLTEKAIKRMGELA